MRSYLTGWGGDLILTAQISKKDLRKIYPHHNFWTDVLSDWMSINCNTPTGISQVLDQQLWCNSLIRINNKPTYYPHWADAGICKIKDMYNPDSKRFFELQQLQQRYAVQIPFTEYFGLLKAIPEQWKNWLSQPVDSQEVAHENKLLKVQGNKIARSLYQYIIRGNHFLQLFTQKWNEQYDFNLTIEEFTKSVHNINKITNVVKKFSVSIIVSSYSY